MWLMKYLLIIISLLIISCTKEQDSKMWMFEDDCTKLGKLVDAKSIKIYDKKEHGKLKTICEISKPRDFVHWLRNEEIEGAVRGIIIYQNRLKVKKLDNCFQESKCSDFNFEKKVKCIHKCEKKVGWNE